MALEAVSIIESVSRTDSEGFVVEVSPKAFARLMGVDEEDALVAIEDARRILADDGAIEFSGSRYRFTDADYRTDVQ